MLRNLRKATRRDQLKFMITHKALIHMKIKQIEEFSTRLQKEKLETMTASSVSQMNRARVMIVDLKKAKLFVKDAKRIRQYTTATTATSVCAMNVILYFTLMVNLQNMMSFN